MSKSRWLTDKLVIYCALILDITDVEFLYADILTCWHGMASDICSVEEASGFLACNGYPGQLQMLDPATGTLRDTHEILQVGNAAVSVCVCAVCRYLPA